MLWISVEALPVERRELIQALLSWTAEVRILPDALDARLSEDLERPGVFFASAAWRTRHALEQHLAGRGFSGLLGAIDLLGTGLQMRLGAELGDADERLERIRGRVRA